MHSMVRKPIELCHNVPFPHSKWCTHDPSNMIFCYPQRDDDKMICIRMWIGSGNCFSGHSLDETNRCKRKCNNQSMHQFYGNNDISGEKKFRNFFQFRFEQLTNLRARLASFWISDGKKPKIPSSSSPFVNRLDDKSWRKENKFLFCFQNFQKRQQHFDESLFTKQK